MELLLSVEIIRDKCQSCLKSLGSLKGEWVVTLQLQETFHNFFGEEMRIGKICNRCHEHLQIFQRFKNEIASNRRRIEMEEANWKFDVQDKFKDDDQELSEEIVIKQEFGFRGDTKSIEEVAIGLDYANETNVKPTKSEVEDSPALEIEISESELPETAKDRKGTKLKSLLDKYKVKYVTDDVGKSTKSPKIFCPICSKILSLLSFATHLKIHKGGREYNFMCEICSAKCASNAELVVHRRRHTKEKPFQCDYCSRQFNCKKNLIAHFRSIHLNQGKRKQEAQQCEICLKKFAPEYLIHQHMKNAHPNGVDDGIKVNPDTNHYHCETCGGQYRTRRYLDIHSCLAGTNDGPTQSECLVCYLKFPSRLEAMKHIQDVHAEKLDKTKWRCLVCNKIVLDKIVLHIECVHTSKSSKCELCNKELKNRLCLKNHIHVMHGKGGELHKRKRKSRETSSGLV